MKAVYGLYPTPESAQRAVDDLRKAGVSDRQITILSSEPFEHFEFAHRDKSTWMNWIAAIGGAGGLTTAYLLTSITQRIWPINTGGMPIVTNWTNMIIIFELTMLGAIFATVATLLVTARIPNFKRAVLYDPEISNGKILIGVANPSDAEGVERALRASGRGELRRVG